MCRLYAIQKIISQEESGRGIFERMWVNNLTNFIVKRMVESIIVTLGIFGDCGCNKGEDLVSKLLKKEVIVWTKLIFWVMEVIKLC